MKFYAIRENHLFRKAYRSGARKSAHSVTVYLLRDKSAGWIRKQHPLKLTVNRIGISASKKVGGAVQRNRAKRVIREAYRMIDKTYGIKRGWLIVIVPKTECTVCSMKDCMRDLLYCFRTLGLLESGEVRESAVPAETPAPSPEIPADAANVSAADVSAADADSEAL